jgi:steroid 5-alpha reductase family enzyme
MWKTVTQLIITLLVIPVTAFVLDEPLRSEQREILDVLLWVYLVACGLVFLTSSVTRNYSQVDKLWSVIPLVYAWIIAIKGGFEPRLVLMAILVGLWGLRLSYNFSRRGGYSWKFWTGEEDYRWAILRAKPEFQPAWKWMLFNLFFISLYQMGLILLFTLPMLKSLGGRPLGTWDYLTGALFLGWLLVETMADQQQWAFHQEKNRRIREGIPLGEKYDRGFVREGLWALARHPNYTAEQAIWGVFYLFSVAATGMWLNWSIVGFLLLTVLFFNSSKFSEKVSAEKYPEYALYQKEVGRFFPKLRIKAKRKANSTTGHTQLDPES